MANPLSADQVLTACRQMGLAPREVPGWRDRGISRARTKSWTPKWITIHHTAGEAPRGTERYIADIINGDRAVPDKANAVIDRAGTLWLNAAGRANHQLFYSASGKHACETDSMPLSQASMAGRLQNGNAFSYGVECIAAGVPNAAQRATAVKWAAAIAKAHGWSGREAVGHGELSYDRSNQIGPAGDPGWDMGAFRRDVMALVAGGGAPPTPPAPPVNADEAARPWWGNRPFPQEPQWLSVSQLRAAMEHDGPAPNQDLYWYADQVWAIQQMLGGLGWLRFGSFVAGHYGTLTKGDGRNQNDGGVAGFQVKRGGTGDGWLGRAELTKLCEMAGKQYPIRD